MRNGKKLAIALLVALFGLAVGNGAALASEPGDNTFPGNTGGYQGNAAIKVCSAGSCGFSMISSEMEISPASDVDYIVATCGNGTVTSIVLHIVSGGGDLDLGVYKPNTTLIGTSTGTGSTETVNTSSAGMNAVVVKVYGYSSATGQYTLDVYCSA